MNVEESIIAASLQTLLNGAYSLRHTKSSAPDTSQLHITHLTFTPMLYSKIDAMLLEEWMTHIRNIKAWYISETQLHLLVYTNVSDIELRELLALCYRYNLDMKQLRAFLRKDNRSWFYDLGRGFWHPYVFSDD